MKIDVIIPVYKPGPELFTLLEKLEDQTAAVRKIILMNTEKQYFARLVPDETTFQREHPRVQVFHLSQSQFDHGGTRHAGVQHSDAEVFITMTQDAMPVDRYLTENLVRGLSEGVAVAYARQLPSEKSGELERITRRFNYPQASRVKTKADLDTLGIRTYFCSNVCAAYRRDIYDELGGFIRHTIFNEDMIYAAGAVKAGYGIAYQAQAAVIHSHNYTNLQQLRRNFDLGVSQADHPEVFGGVSSESEGRKLVKETWKDLKKKHRLYRFPGFVIQCGCKYVGYFLGKHYRKLPRNMILALTGNRAYWG